MNFQSRTNIAKGGPVFLGVRAGFKIHCVCFGFLYFLFSGMFCGNLFKCLRHDSFLECTPFCSYMNTIKTDLNLNTSFTYNLLHYICISIKIRYCYFQVNG